MKHVLLQNLVRHRFAKTTSRLSQKEPAKWCHRQSDTRYQNAIQCHPLDNYRMCTTTSDRQLCADRQYSTRPLNKAEMCKLSTLPAAQYFAVSHVGNTDALILLNYLNSKQGRDTAGHAIGY